MSAFNPSLRKFKASWMPDLIGELDLRYYNNLTDIANVIGNEITNVLSLRDYNSGYRDDDAIIQYKVVSHMSYVEVLKDVTGTIVVSNVFINDRCCPL